MKHFSFFVLFFIFILGALLRFYQLGDFPVGFHRDEAFFGYNAYSLIKTGNEIAGNFLPLHLKSFLYSPAGYSYASIPFVWIFGLNEFAVRFAAAFFGSATVLLVYFLVRELFVGKVSKFPDSLALLSSFFLAISPWHINLSRASAENVLVVFFITLGVLLYLQWVRKERMWLLILSMVAFGVTLILYQAPRAFLPIFVPFLFLCFHPKPWKKHLIAQSILFLMIIIVPVVTILSSHNLTQRIRMLSVFQNPATQLVLDEQIREDGSTEQSTLLTRFFHNKGINYSVTFFSNYFGHFSYNFLFLDSGFPDRYRVPQMGILYFFDLLFLLFGFWKLGVLEKKNALFLGGWILLAPFGSAFTYDDVPNLQRTLIIFPALSIVIAYGFLQIWQLMSKTKFVYLLRGVLVLVMVYGFLYYLHQYYVHQVHHRPWFRQVGYKELVVKLDQIHNNYKRVMITDAESDPAIFFMFYNRYDPAIVQKELKSHPTDRYGQMPLENYVFVREACPLHILPQESALAKAVVLSGQKDVLYVNSGNCKLVDPRVETVSEIKRPDGTVVFALQIMKQ